MPTKEKTFIWVDTYARWRISDALQFFKRVKDERGAQSRLDDIIDGETRNVIASHELKKWCVALNGGLCASVPDRRGSRNRGNRGRFA
ncbi:MAG: SPFH domain-containing protein [Myxococcota bacterium]